jgi:hypothetical protein
MRSSVAVLALVTLTAATIAAQAPGTPPAPMGGARGGAPSGNAQMLLARSAELGLTDAQIVKLAAIARRAEARRNTMRAALDSGRTRFTGPGDSTARRQFAQRMQTDMAKERDQSRVDLRDAITVLTPDQQAKAWEMNSQRGMRGGRGVGGGRGVARAPRGPRPDGAGAGRGARRPDDMGPGGRPGMQRGDMRDRRPMDQARPGRPGRPFDEFNNERNPQ